MASRLIESFDRNAFSHPIYDTVRPWLARLTGWPDHRELSEFAAEAGVQTAGGVPVRFVAPRASDPYYEIRVHETGGVPTRLENWHDLFNALAWLAFPRSKAVINALHAAEIPRESGTRGRLRDLLTILDEGGAVVLCADPELEAMIRGFRWADLFWGARERVLRGLRFVVLGHAVLEQARRPWPGIACKVIFLPHDSDPDAGAADWLRENTAAGTPKLLAPVPVFGYPGWLPETANREFYADERYFRPLRRVDLGSE